MAVTDDVMVSGTSAAPRPRWSVPQQTRELTRGRVTVVFVLLVLATVPWRSDSLFDGSLDAIVAAKAVLTGIALLLAWSIWGAAGHRQSIRTVPVVLLVLYLTVSVLGAWSAGNLFASGVLAVRIGLIATAVLLVVTSVASQIVLDQLFVATTVVALVSGLTGLGSLTGGRLAGGIPNIHPNELSMLCAVSVLGISWRALRSDGQARLAWLVAPLSVLLWLTGSRSSFMAMLVGVALMLTHVRRLHAAAVVALHLVAAMLAYIVLATTLFSGFLSRGDDGLSTLTSRTVAWSAALDYSDSAWTQWMGAGLSVKVIPVAGQYWNTQVFDSSWISGLVHAGRIGGLLLIVWALWALVASRQGSLSQRMLLTPLIVYLLIRSTLESGLVDSTAAFTIFLVVGLTADRSAVVRHSELTRIGTRTGQRSTAPADLRAGTLVDLNRATVEELQTLPWIGPARAIKIIEARERDGAFTSIDDLGQVPGLGPKTLEQLAAAVTF